MRGVHDAMAGVLGRMSDELDRLESERDPGRHFLATYRRVTLAVAEAADAGRIEDPDWLARWDAEFADLYLAALAAHRADPPRAPAPWRAAFAAPEDLEPYRHVLLGMNAHINYDMPQSLLRVVADADLADEDLLASRQRDHHRLDGVIVALVPQESRHLARVAPRALTLLDRLLQPVSRAASRQLLRESRHRVWGNTLVLLRARADDEALLVTHLRRLETLSAQRVDDLLRPRHPLLHLARRGFGVRLDG